MFLALECVFFMGGHHGTTAKSCERKFVPTCVLISIVIYLIDFEALTKEKIFLYEPWHGTFNNVVCATCTQSDQSLC